MSIKKTLIISCTILCAGVFIAWLFVSTKPKNVRVAPQVSSPMVNAVLVKIGNANIDINALGIVKAAEETIVRSRVVGQVETLGKNSEIGAVVQKNELLAQLDPAIYKNILNSKKSELAKARADYDLEIGQQKVARAEAEQIKNIYAGMKNITNNIEVSSLALRAPHLAKAKAVVETARAAVQLAQLNVDYTTIKTPYNALITTRNISVGSQASISDSLFVLVGTDEYYIEAGIALDRLEALNIKNNVGTKVRVVSGAGIVREGVVLRTIATLDPSTRMGRLLISVPDPLGLINKKPALILGDQARVELVAGTLDDVIVLPRASLHSGDVVWVAVPKKPSSNELEKLGKNKGKSDYTLDIRPVTVVWKDTQTVYIRDGIRENEFIITSLIPSPIQGMGLRLTPQSTQKQEAENMLSIVSSSSSKNTTPIDIISIGTISRNTTAANITSTNTTPRGDV